MSVRCGTRRSSPPTTGRRAAGTPRCPAQRSSRRDRGSDRRRRRRCTRVSPLRTRRGDRVARLASLTARLSSSTNDSANADTSAALSPIVRYRIGFGDRRTRGDVVHRGVRTLGSDHPAAAASNVALDRRRPGRPWVGRSTSWGGRVVHQKKSTPSKLWQPGRCYVRHMTTIDVPPTTLPWHLRGNWAPVLDERTDTDLRVDGTIPAELEGTYVRTGPNPASGAPTTGSSATAWCTASGSPAARPSGTATASSRRRTSPTRGGDVMSNMGDLTRGTGNTHVLAAQQQDPVPRGGPLAVEDRRRAQHARLRELRRGAHDAR